MSTFELSFTGEIKTEVAVAAPSQEAQFYFLHADHVLYLMSD
jgi:hypothetical protein